MSFNTLTFVAFFLIVYLFYLVLRGSFRAQNFLLLGASYVFYGSWDWRFLSLLLISTLVDFFVARAIHLSKNSSARRYFLTVSVATNLSILGFFKYFNFFTESFVELLNTVGLTADYPTLNIILPVGISFYTFQSMSYTIDIYRRRLEPTNNIFDFALFVSFFPQLVAGPIERASNLLPQIIRPRQIAPGMVDAGIFLILWGYFQKVVIADNVGVYSDLIFGGYQDFEGLDILVGILAFTVQIYCDFSGYSDIARGICKLLGIELMVNFRLPYFALSPRDFWSRWHISLSSWLRDYLYIPLGGNQGGTARTFCNLMLTMLLAGLWHGAAWNFVIWGAYHGSLLVLYSVFDTPSKHPYLQIGPYPYIIVLFRIFSMFTLTLVGWVIFRSQSVHQIAYILHHSLFFTFDINMRNAYELLIFSSPLILIQTWQYLTGDLLIATKQGTLARGLIYGFLFFGIIVFGARESMEFIYFQF